MEHVHDCYCAECGADLLRDRCADGCGEPLPAPRQAPPEPFGSKPLPSAGKQLSFIQSFDDQPGQESFA